jgi:hypothetical protein
MVALLVVSVIAAIEAVVIVLGRNKLKADIADERAKVAVWLDGLAKKAEVAIRREAEILSADIKSKV